MKLTKLFTITLLALSCSYATANSQTTTDLPQNTQLVKAGGKYITLLGQQVSVGDKAPNFKVVNDAFTPVNLSDYSNKILLISAVPSLDTGVCSLQTKRFNEEIIKFSKDIQVLTLSNDLPFAQKRFCKTEKIDNVTVLSDSVWRDFGTKYGLLIKDMGLLTRAIFIIDGTGKIAYKELVEELSSHPDYDTALATLEALSSNNANKTPAEQGQKVVNN